MPDSPHRLLSGLIFLNGATAEPNTGCLLKTYTAEIYQNGLYSTPACTYSQSVINNPVNALNFLIHLRLHYQFFILSGGYLLGGLLVDEPDLQQYWLQFLNVHVLLFGGATAFNSYWDKDEGPIGGLRHPPKMERWMRDVSILMQVGGFVWAAVTGPVYAGVYLVSMILFWLYSTPLARWKGRPLLSMIAIGGSTGTNSLILGVLAAGADLTWLILFAGIGTALIMLSLYPISQLYQMEADRQRGDTTFAIQFGLAGVRRFFSASFITGIVVIAIILSGLNVLLAAGFGGVGMIVWGILIFWIFSLKGEKNEYGQVMKIKYVASIAFVMFIVTGLLLKHL
jgi:4-hydroxybenzoate polyprenyltransferase